MKPKLKTKHQSRNRIFWYTLNSFSSPVFFTYFWTCVSSLTLVSWWLSLAASPELSSPYHAETLSCPPECSELSALHFDPSEAKGNMFIINYLLMPCKCSVNLYQNHFGITTIVIIVSNTFICWFCCHRWIMSQQPSLFSQQMGLDGADIHMLSNRI